MTELFMRVSGPPVGKARPRSRVVTPRGKAPFVQLYTDKETRAYEEAVGYCGRLALNRAGLKAPLSGPLEVTIVAYFAVPAGWPEWKRKAALDGTIRPTTKPDRDNIEKIIMDGLNGVLFEDDAQAVDGRTVKLYAAEARVEVFIEPMDECAGMQISSRRNLPALHQEKLFEEPEESSTQEDDAPPF